MKTLSKNTKQIIGGVVISVLLLSIPIAAIIKSYDMSNALIALAVTQLCITFLWLIIRSGFFSTSSLGARNYAKNQLHKKNEKIGVYGSSKESKIKINEYNSKNDIEENSMNKSRFGIYAMLLIGVIELVIALIVTFA